MPRVLTRRGDHGEAVQARGRRGEAERKVGEEALTSGARLPERGDAGLCGLGCWHLVWAENWALREKRKGRRAGMLGFAMGFPFLFPISYLKH